MSEQLHEDHDTGRRGRGRASRDGSPWGIVRRAADALTVRRAFGEPIRQGDVTIVPVARVMGGGGAGYGTSDGLGASASGPDAGSGGGGGFGLRVTPVGVYVVEGSTVRWEPAFDLTRVALVGSAVGALTVTVLACALRRRGHRCR
ncbi:spore germination protein GerW family protein [Actinotalea sp.]|uniref:spore germination protein GerW family protein n=1 Tax=Actinotalea sp. TaxID=1872145 RepID=UPI002C2401F2|nr:spore germination protein GerW family protein [Actinotalea sp.]HQY34518.1 spore germination protein GerW family protein [Actinotalea sp.]HRA50470.1 spore germination protein GerW family protein [Actinotalea sp.]